MERPSDKPEGADCGMGGLNGGGALEKGELVGLESKGSSPVKKSLEGQSMERTKGVRGPYRKTRGIDGGGYGHLYGNLYEQAQARRQKVLGFLQKDLFQIGRPDLRRFMNLNHAYECLLPYHIFGFDLYEDMLFMNSKEVDGISMEIDEMMGLLKEITVLENRPLATEDTLVCELLLYYQQRYINSVYGDGRKQRAQKRYRQQLSKRNTIFRLKIGLRPQKGNDVDIRNGKLYFKKSRG
ncbi:uncharacterized protein Eint_080960 [Encephalitozoon intestinalis ATCC 50506]|uniref:GLTSCR protein conserved domain-containing protein n=1 Tax=Encephalitozoon intestinalis (strain ATCC 50506) TaxID=876142 RepID=E0S8P5_ENCIT|nr:uncharacterized protein Eint_080960 [Encephalitozoon intestinalis ATCC 50506]ADM12028.1 hypothetical protein Eint_080960 [Encephalitozoon intestinalis ATCC 50506]UTX45817.1 hypothetical protein GPK93_08g13960 [Encephalitozoon intestinalis]